MDTQTRPDQTRPEQSRAEDKSSLTRLVTGCFGLVWFGLVRLVNKPVLTRAYPQHSIGMMTQGLFSKHWYSDQTRGPLRSKKNKKLRVYPGLMFYIHCWCVSNIAV